MCQVPGDTRAGANKTKEALCAGASFLCHLSPYFASGAIRSAAQEGLGVALVWADDGFGPSPRIPPVSSLVGVVRGRQCAQRALHHA